MNTWAKRGSMSHVKYGLMYWGKNRNQTANHAAAAAPRSPQPNRDRRTASIPTHPLGHSPRASLRLDPTGVQNRAERQPSNGGFATQSAQRPEIVRWPTSGTKPNRARMG